MRREFSMVIERKHTADLIPADYNPRKDLKPGDAEYEKLKRSIEQFGYLYEHRENADMDELTRMLRYILATEREVVF